MKLIQIYLDDETHTTLVKNYAITLAAAEESFTFEDYLLFLLQAVSPCLPSHGVQPSGIKEKTIKVNYPRAGLISKQNGKYFLTTFDKVVYNLQRLVGKAKDNFWKLRAIESFESSDRRMSVEELSKIIEKLIVEDDSRYSYGSKKFTK